MTPEFGRRVIDVARGLIGSHYINGAYGATPGGFDGAPVRPGGIQLIADEAHLDPKFNERGKSANLAVNAATMSIKTYCVCAGSYFNSRGGRATDADSPDLVAYLDSLKGTPPSNWPNFNGRFTPRRAFGPGQNGGDGAGKLVWGESCKGVRHFDCIGFVFYCIWKANGDIPWYEIKGWRTPTPGRQVFKLNEIEYSDEKDNKKLIRLRPSALMDGDILIQADHHIGLVAADGTMYQAEDTHLGVTSTPGFRLSASGKWTHLVRYGGADTEALPWPLGWWHIWDGNNWYYYFAPKGVVMSSKQLPYNTRRPPAHAHNTGVWSHSPPNTLVVTWKQVAGAPKPCMETFYNAGEGCAQMNANSNLYSPLVAKCLV